MGKGHKVLLWCIWLVFKAEKESICLHLDFQLVDAISATSTFFKESCEFVGYPVFSCCRFGVMLFHTVYLHPKQRLETHCNLDSLISVVEGICSFSLPYFICFFTDSLPSSVIHTFYFNLVLLVFPPLVI